MSVAVRRGAACRYTRLLIQKISFSTQTPADSDSATDHRCFPGRRIQATIDERILCGTAAHKLRTCIKHQRLMMNASRSEVQPYRSGKRSHSIVLPVCRPSDLLLASIPSQVRIGQSLDAPMSDARERTLGMEQCRCFLSIVSGLMPKLEGIFFRAGSEFSRRQRNIQSTHCV